MPIYEYFCQNCELNHEVIKPMSAIDQIEYCPLCSCSMIRQMPLFIPQEFKPYYSMNLSPYDDRDILVESKSHRKKLMKQAHVVDWWPGNGRKGQWI